jgi:hypothetical protein
VLIKNDHSPTMSPLLNPYGHVVFQAGRGDVHTVLVGGEIVKFDGRLTGGDLNGAKAKIEATVEHLRSTLGDDLWQQGMNPDIPETTILDNPYGYTEFSSDATRRAHETFSAATPNRG